MPLYCLPEMPVMNSVAVQAVARFPKYIKTIGHRRTRTHPIRHYTWQLNTATDTLPGSSA